MPFVECAIQHEVDICRERNTLFRQASVFVNIMAVLYRDRASRRFIKAVVQPLAKHGAELGVSVRMAQLGFAGNGETERRSVLPRR